MKYFVFGLNHQSASISLREKLAHTSGIEETLLQGLQSGSELEELCFLSTCNRVELYGVAEKAHDHELLLKKIFSQHFDVSYDEINSNSYFLADLDAVYHGFRVASSLDSMVLGEPQILGQFKEAFRKANEKETTGIYLNKFFQRSFKVAKMIRQETAIGENPVSISFAAVTLARQIFGDLSECKIMILGAGKMGELALQHLNNFDVDKIYVTNRNPDKAKVLAERYGGESIPFENFSRWLSDCDIVITSTDAGTYLIKKDMIQESQNLRKGDPLFLIDISVPRNIDPAIESIDNVYLYNIDDLGHLVDENLKSRKREAKKAKAMVLGEAYSFIKELNELSVVPTISSLNKKFDHIRKLEVEKTLMSLGFENPEFSEALDQCSKAILKKVLHDPMIAIKEDAKKGSDKVEILDWVHKLFKLDPS